MRQYSNIEELYEQADKLINKKISDFDIYNRYGVKSNSKGFVGQIIQEGGFHKKLDSSKEVDIPELGIELKSTGYKWVYKETKVSAKERLVLRVIDFEEESKQTFETTRLREKLDNFLLVLYEYDKDKYEKDFVITNWYHYRFKDIPKKDQKIIEDDWKLIHQKILNGEAHNLSEGDTSYLGACTKGVSSETERKQPFSDKMAKQRAFSLKTRYMTDLMRTKIFKDVQDRETFIKDYSLLADESLDSLILKQLNQHAGNSLNSISKKLEINLKPRTKGYYYDFFSQMLGVKSINNVDEFIKAGISLKTVRILENGKPQEHMSFPHIDYVELSKTDWEDSKEYDLFRHTKFLIVVLDKKNDDYVFREAKLWTMPENDIENYVKPVYNQLKSILNNKLKIAPMSSNQKSIGNNLPKASDYPVCHIRPHGSNREDTIHLPEMTKIIIEKESEDDRTNQCMQMYKQEHCFSKQSFWLHKDYVLTTIVNGEEYEC